MGTLLRDLRFTARSLARSPGWPAIVVATLGLGIGAVVAIFSVAYGVLFQPLPYRDSERSCASATCGPIRRSPGSSFSPQDVDDLVAAHPDLASVAAYSYFPNLSGVNLTGARRARARARGHGVRQLLRHPGTSRPTRAHAFSGGRPAGAQPRRRPELRSVAAPFPLRSGHRRPADHPRRHPVHGRRRDADGVPDSRRGGRSLGAAVDRRGGRRPPQARGALAPGPGPPAARRDAGIGERRSRRALRDSPGNTRPATPGSIARSWFLCRPR